MSNSKYEREYIHKTKLGWGGFGTVHSVENKQNNEVTAMKIIDLNDRNETFMKCIKREINILSNVESPYIVQYRTSFIEGTQVYIEMELCPIDLDQLIYQTKKEMKIESLSEKPMSYYVCCELFVQILKGVEYLHKNSIIHRDLKPKNILLKCEEQIQVKLADFGVSRIKDFDGKSMTAYTGTKGRWAPEMNSRDDILKAHYDHKVDIWSLGHIIDDLFGIKAIKFMNENLRNKTNFVNELKKSLFTEEPQNRPECSSILENSYQWILSIEELAKIDAIEEITKDNETKASLNRKFVLFYLRQKLGLKSVGIIENESLDGGVNLNDEINILLHYPKFQNSFTDIRRLGMGGFGEVFSCKDTSTNKISAIKRIYIAYNDLSNPHYMAESKIMKEMDSEYIVKFYESWIEKDARDLFLYISMELCLKSLKEFNKQILKELNCKSICDSSIGFYILNEVIRDITEGLNYLHKKGLIHRDIKPENIMIVDKQNGIMTKISDFGISAYHSVEASLTGDVGDPRYIAPELRQWSASGRLLYDFKVDIYSLGVTFKNLCIREQQSFNPIDDELKAKMNLFNGLLKSMTSVESHQRPNAEEILRIISDSSLNITQVFNTSDIEIKLQNRENVETMDQNFISYYMRIELNLIYNDFMALKRRRISVDNVLMERIQALI